MWMWTPLWPPPSRGPIQVLRHRADTVAANPEKKVPSDLPQIPGAQEKVMKTVADERPVQRAIAALAARGGKNTPNGK